MFFSSKEDRINFKHKLLCSFEDFTGSRSEYDFKRRFFNVICLVLFIFYLAGVLINLVLEINHSALLLGHSISALFVLIIFFISRYKKKLSTSLLFFFVIVLGSLSMDWFYTGGISGVVLFFYFSLFTVVIFILDKRYRFFVFLLILIHVTLLYFLEHKFPHLVIHINENHKLYIYLYFIFASMLTFLIIQIGKTLYRIQKIEYLRLDDHGYERIERIKRKLTKREKDIFDLMFEGKKNRQIAAMLFINESTVKTHINNIRKKIGDIDRNNLLIL